MAGADNKTQRRVNTKVVIDMTSGNILEQEGYFYGGPFAEAAGADKQSLDAIFKEVGSQSLPGSSNQ